MILLNLCDDHTKMVVICDKLWNALHHDRGWRIWVVVFSGGWYDIDCSIVSLLQIGGTRIEIESRFKHLI